MTVRRLGTVTRSGLVAQAIEEFRTRIADGSWPVGQRIPVEAELAAHLGVGRNTVREAVGALVHTGLLESRQGYGTFVVRRDELGGVLARILRNQDLRAVLEVRRALEAEAAGLAAQRRTQRQLTRIKRAYEEARAALARGDIDAVLLADTEFHSAVADASGNRVLVQVYSELLEVVRAYVRTMRARRPSSKESLIWHGKLVAAIEDRDERRARRAAVALLEQHDDQAERRPARRVQAVAPVSAQKS